VTLFVNFPYFPHLRNKFISALGVMAIQNYEPEEDRDTRSIRSGLSRHSSVVSKQNKENQDQARRPAGVRMGTRAVFESRESLVISESTTANSPEPAIPEAYILSKFYFIDLLEYFNVK